MLMEKMMRHFQLAGLISSAQTSANLDTGIASCMKRSCDVLDVNITAASHISCFLNRRSDAQYRLTVPLKDQCKISNIYLGVLSFNSLVMFVTVVVVIWTSSLRLKSQIGRYRQLDR